MFLYQKYLFLAEHTLRRNSFWIKPAWEEAPQFLVPWIYLVKKLSFSVVIGQCFYDLILSYQWDCVIANSNKYLVTKVIFGRTGACYWKNVLVSHANTCTNIGRPFQTWTLNRTCCKNVQLDFRLSSVSRIGSTQPKAFKFRPFMQGPTLFIQSFLFWDVIFFCDVHITPCWNGQSRQLWLS